MKRRVRLTAVSVLAAALALGGVLAAAADRAEAQEPDEAVSELREAYLDAYNAGDAEAAASFFHEEGAKLRPGEGPATGRDEIRDFLAGTFELQEIQMLALPEDRRMDGDVAVERGMLAVTVTLVDNGETADTSGKYVLVAERDDDGEWKLLWFIWNQDVGPGLEE